MLHLAYNIYHYIQIAKRYNINKVILKLEHDSRKAIDLKTIMKAVGIFITKIDSKCIVKGYR